MVSYKNVVQLAHGQPTTTFLLLWFYNAQFVTFSLQGFATRFVLTAAIENGGKFEDTHIAQLRRLGGWAQNSAVVHLYVKRIIEEYTDTAALIMPGEHSIAYKTMLIILPDANKMTTESAHPPSGKSD